MSEIVVKRQRDPAADEGVRAMRWRALYLMASLGIFSVDQITKAWAIRRLRFGASIDVIPGFAKLLYAENTGVAFGQLQRGGSTGRWLLASFAGAAAAGVLVYFFRTPRSDDRVLGACALLLAGILGNLADRIRYGFVVDFVSLYLGDFHYPIFNVADVAICVGAGLLLLDAFMSGKSPKSEVGSQQ